MEDNLRWRMTYQIKTLKPNPTKPNLPTGPTKPYLPTKPTKPNVPKITKPNLPQQISQAYTTKTNLPMTDLTN